MSAPISITTVSDSAAAPATQATTTSVTTTTIYPPMSNVTECTSASCGSMECEKTSAPICPPASIQEDSSNKAYIEQKLAQAKYSGPAVSAPIVPIAMAVPAGVGVAQATGVTSFQTPARHHATTAHLAAPAFDPRPSLKVDREVHDFEVHREGNYAKGHVFPGVRPNATYGDSAATTTGYGTTTDPTTGATGVMTDATAGHIGVGGPARTFVHREGVYAAPVAGEGGQTVVGDPRPVLKTEREVHDYEVHRQGAHAAGHTRPGVRPEGTFVGATPATVDVKGNTVYVNTVPNTGVPVKGAPLAPVVAAPVGGTGVTPLNPSV